VLGAWCLVDRIWNLVFGAWCLVLGNWNLEFGIHFFEGTVDLIRNFPGFTPLSSTSVDLQHLIISLHSMGTVIGIALLKIRLNYLRFLT
jgi:hypothetical protein